MADLHPDEIKIGPNTDYDLYTKYSKWGAFDLYRLGFMPYGEDYSYGEGYGECDNDVHSIWSKNNVQIVFRYNIEMYKQVFDNLPVEFYKKYIWKSSGQCVTDTKQKIALFNALLKEMPRFFNSITGF